MRKPKLPPPPPAPPPAPGAAAAKARAHPRTRVQLSAEIDTFQDRFTASTRDLSIGGVGLDLDRPLKENATVAISLFLVVDEIEDEATAPMNVRAKVAWCAESDAEGHYTAGVHFDDLLPQQREWLAHFLALISKG